MIRSLLDPALVERVARRAQAGGEREALGPITGPERDLLALIAKGLTNRPIVGRTSLAETTVKRSISDIPASQLRPARFLGARSPRAGRCGR